jgi:uncharacterized membrane protein YeaQ/YmgE (transglycosylase-associated protein family)
MDFVTYINSETAWLYTKIYQNRLFFFDLWSLVHLWSGFMIYLLIRASRSKRPFLVLVSILVIYEIVEILAIYIALTVFRPETIKDQFTDIFLGIIGGVLCRIFLTTVRRHWERFQGLIHAFIIFVVGSSYDFFWVGFYRYHYNVDYYNTPGINVSTLIAWTTCGMVILGLFRLFGKMKLILRLVLTWIIYFIGLLIFEYTYYYVLLVRETTGLPLRPLIFGLIHGTRTLHVFYMTAPFILISVYEFGLWLVSRASATNLSSARRGTLFCPPNLPADAR